MPPIISIVGKSKTGKTSLIEKLIPELKRRGYKVGTMKHASNGFDFDKKGKDSWRHHAAGADTVIVASPGKIAMVKIDAWRNLKSFEIYFEDLDLVITEGFKLQNTPKIEVFRSASHQKPRCLDDPNIIALVADADFNLTIPTFEKKDIEKLADFIQMKFLPVRS